MKSILEKKEDFERADKNQRPLLEMPVDLNLSNIDMEEYLKQLFDEDEADYSKTDKNLIKL